MKTESRRGFAQASLNARTRSKAGFLLNSTALVAVGGAFALLPSAAFAQSWDGEADTDFANPVNWDTNTVPGPGNTVTINSGAIANQPLLNTNQTVAQTTISSGIFTLAATLTSPVTVSNTGILRIAPNGNVVGGINVLSGGTLELSSNSAPSIFFSASTTLNGTGAGGNGALRNLAGANAITGAITLGSASTIASAAGRMEILGGINTNGHLLTSAGSGTTVFSGVISGAGGFTKNGSGQTDLNATNTYEGTTTVNSGVLIVNNGTGIIDTGRVVVNGGAFAIFNDETIGSLEGTGGFVSVSVSSGTRRLTVGGNNLSTSYAGDLRNNGGGELGLIKAGTGTLTLTRASTYSGGTTINNGTIVAGNNTALGTGQVNLTQSGTKLVTDFNGTFANNLFVVGTGTSGTFAAATGRTVAITGDIITGPDVTVNFGSATETGTIVFNSAISGNVTTSSRFAINGGTLRLANGSAAQAAGTLFAITEGLTIGSGGTLDLGGADFNGTATRGSGTILNSGAESTLRVDFSRFAGTLNTGANGIRLEGSMSELGALTKRGAGRLTLTSGLNPIGYTGGLTLAEGTLSLQRTLPGTFGTITTTGSVIEYDNTIINNAPIALNSDTTQLRVASGDATQAGVISQVGGTARGFEKIGAGNLTLSVANTYEGVTTVSQGTLTVASFGALGSAAGGTVVADGAGLIFSASPGGLEAITLNGSGVGGTGALRNTVTVNLGGPITLGSNSLIQALATTAINLDSVTGTNSTLTLGGAGNIAIGGALSLGSGGLILNGTGTVSLFSNNSFAGQTTINSGILFLGNSQALPDSSQINVNAPGTLRVDSNETIGALTGNGTVDIVAGRTLSVGSGNVSSAFSGEIQSVGMGGLTKIGTGTLTLTGANTYSGITTISGGTLQIGDGGSTGTLGSGNVTNNAALVFDRSIDFTVANVITGTGSLTKRGAGNLTLSGMNFYQGVTTVSAGTLTAANGFALGGNLGNTVVQGGASLVLAAQPMMSEEFTLNGAGVGGAGALRSTVTMNLAGAITLGSDATISSGAGTLDLAGITGTNVNLTLAGAGSVRINGSLSLGTGGLTLNGTGFNILSGNNSFSGPVTLTAGALQINGGAAIGDASLVSMSPGTSFELLASERIGALEGAGIVAINSGRTLTLGDATNRTFSGQISTIGFGPHNLVKEGTGTLTLTGDSSFVGTTTINAGTLQIGNGGNTGSLGSGNIINNAALVINRGSVPSFSNNISGTGSLTIESSVAVFLSGSSSYSGVTTISSGTVVITTANALGNTTGNTIVSSGATLANRFAGTLAEAITLNGGGVGNGGALRIDENTIVSGAITLGSAARISTVAGRSSSFTGGISGNDLDLTVNAAGSISIGSALSLGTGSLIKEGLATLTLSGSNTYGATTISAGTLRIGAGGNLGSGDVLNNGQLAFSRSDSITVNNVINGTGIVEQSGSGTLTLTGANGYSGGTRLSSSGRIAVGSNSALGTGIVELDMGSTLQLGVATTPGVSAGPITLANGIRLNRSANLDLVGTSAAVNEFNGNYGSTGTVATLNGVIEGGHRLTIIGGGTLTLNGNNTYSLGTNVGQALIQVGHANALGTGAVTLGGVSGLRNTTGGALTLANDIAVDGIGVTIGGTSNFTLTGNLSGNGSLFKVQGNTLAINSAVNDFSGVLRINGGTALVNGTMGNAAASVIVNNNGTLGGTGTIAGAVTVNSGGTLAAGQSAGTLRLESNLTLNAGSNTIFELAQAGVAGGPNNDLIRVTGNLALNGGGIRVVRGTGFSAGQYTLFEYTTLSGDIDNMTLAALDGGFAGSLAVGTNVVLLNVAGAADQVRWNGSTLASVGTIVGGSGTWDLVSTNFSNAAATVSGPWAGNGALAIFGGTAGGGTVTIANDTVLAPSGLTFETNGYTITGGNAGSRLDLTGPTGIETLAGISATIAAPITGAGSITKNGDGTLVLTGDNSYAGGTTILAGTLQVGNGGASGTLGTGNVTNGASLVFNRTDRTVVGGAISGSGTLTQQGTGETVLAGANIYDGLTTVAAGTLRAANSGALGSTAAGTVVNSGATLAIEGELTIAEAITLNGSGVTGGGALRGVLTDRAGNQTSELQGLITLASDATITVVDRMGLIFTGPGIRGSGTQTLTFASEGTGNSTIRALGPITNIAGLIKNGPGLLELSGANTFAGPVTINGGDVNLTGGAALVDSVAVTMSAPARLAIAASETIGSLAGSGSVLLGTNMLTTGRNNASTSFGGVISGNNGRLTKVGTGTFTLTGANTYTGATRIEGGTLALGANDVIANGSFVTLVGGTLSLGTFTDTVLGVELAAGSITGSTGSALSLVGNYIQTGGTLAAGATVNAGTLGTIFLSAGTVAGTLNGLRTGTRSGIVDGGTARVTGRLTMAGDLLIGEVATGRLNIADGGVVRAREGLIGLAALSVGSATVSGVGSRWENTSALVVGSGGSGSLVIENGGFVSSASSFVSFTASGPGSVVVTGAGSRWENAGDLQLGTRGAGTLTIADGGAVTAANVVIARDATATGTLIFGAAEGSAAAATGTLASPTITLGAGAATIIFNHTAADFELAAAISGNGALRQLAGTTTLSGASTFTGTTSVLGGTLRVTGALASAVTNNAALTNSGTISGLVTNSGSLASTGTLGGGLVNAAGASAAISGVLTGAVSNSGTVTLTGATTGITTFEQVAGGVFDLGGLGTSIGSLAGAGSVSLGAGTLTAGGNNGSTTFSGVIAGSGGLVKTGTGTFTLAGLNTYAGLTTVSAGTLALASGGALAGAVTNAATFNTDGTVGGLVTNSGQLLSLGTLSAGLTNTAGASAQLANAVSGAISNAGAIELVGSLSAGGAFTQAATGSLNLAGFSAGLGSLAGSGTIALGGGTLSVGSNDGSSLFDGVISGTGALVKTGAGTLTLNALQTFTGLTTVSGGTLTVSGTGGLAGAVLNAASLTNAGTIGGQVSNTAGGNAVNSGTIGGALVNAGTFSNTGSVSGGVSNAGTLTSSGTIGTGLENAGTASLAGGLNGFVTNTGAITLAGTTSGITAFSQTAPGSLDLAGFDTAIGGLSGAGSVVLGAARLTTGSGNAGTVFAGVISGSGSLAKTGTGTMVLSGANTYTGGTTITAGTLQIGENGTTGSIIGPVVNNGALVISRSDAVTFGNLVTGTGMLVQDGTGTTTLTAANTYSGGTLVNRGRLVGSTTSLQGLIQINAGAALEFAQAAAGTFAGQLAGAGLFEKTGAGLLTLTGNSNAFTGATSVRAGELRVNGALAGSVVTVGTGATLSGTGVIGGLIAQSGSTIAPGTSPGVLGVNGNVTLQAGSTSVFEVSAAGPSDLILATGTATLGGTAALINLGGDYRFGSQITLVQADGGTSGTFANVTGLAGFGIRYRPELVYVAGQARLRMAPNTLANIAGTSALTANQRSVVSRIDGAMTAGYNPDPLFAIYSLPTASLPGAFDQLSGEAYATAAGVGIEQERLMREAVLGRLAATSLAGRNAPESATGPGVWGQVYGGWGDGESNGNAAAFDADRMGFITGLDYGRANETGSWRLGIYGMRVQSDVTIAARGSASEVRQAGGGVYAGLTTGGFAAALGGYLTEVDLRTFRSITLPGFTDNLTGTTQGKARQAFAELSYTIAAGAAQIRPFVAGSVGSFRLDALTERGGAAALTMREQRYDTGTLTGGINADVQVAKVLQLGATLAARRHLGERDPQAQLALAAAPQQAFAINGAQLDRTALAARLDAMFTFEENLSITLGYSGLIGNTQTDHSATATIAVRF